MRGRIVCVVLLSLVDTCLSEEGSPADTIGSADVRTWVISDHEEATFTMELFHVVLHELKSSLFRLAEIALGELELMAPAMFLQHIVEWSKGQSGSVISSRPNYVILSCKIGRKWQASLFLLSKDVVDDFESGLIGTDIIEREDGVDDLPPLVVISW